MKRLSEKEKTAWFSNNAFLFRTLGCITGLFALVYSIWRCMKSLNMNALWFAIPLLLAELYGILDLFLFILLTWKPVKRVMKKYDSSNTVDVFITIYNEPPELLQTTVDAAMKIDWKNKNVCILDDGNRPEIKAIADKASCSYITRGSEWDKKPKHAKAGNVNNALMQTSGDFILILDTDQIPNSQILKHTMGYFSDLNVAFVQTPQHFYNIPKGDPFGVDAPFFYGPIMQGKDGWNAAFFCGSNGILRREALMREGLIHFVEKTGKAMMVSLRALLQFAKSFKFKSKEERAIILKLQKEIKESIRELKNKKPYEVVSDSIAKAVKNAANAFSNEDLLHSAASLKALAESGDDAARSAYEHIINSLNTISAELSKNNTIGFSDVLMQKLKMTMPEEAIPIQALATISITEDMATALYLHSHGWKSVYHNEILAEGLSPDDLGSMLSQRLRWAQGTIQVFKRENPLLLKGLSLPQKLLYFASIFSYFSGFASLMFLLAPLIYLFFSISPVSAWSTEFFIRFIPFYIMNKIFFKAVTRGIPLFRGEQYSMALFPVWIKAVVSVFLNWKITFKVTPKQRQSGNFLLLVWPQILFVLITVIAILFHTTKIILGENVEMTGFIINTFWGIYNIVMLQSIIRAAVYKKNE